MMTGERFEHRHDWRRGLNGHTRIPYSSGASHAEIAWGELRHLMGGATSLNGSGSVSGFLRNLDRSSLEEGLAQRAVHYQTFPLDDSSGTTQTSDCDYGSGPDTEASIAYDHSYMPHVAEGIDQRARERVRVRAHRRATTSYSPRPRSSTAVGLVAARLSS